jgi:hypothetical protein
VIWWDTTSRVVPKAKDISERVACYSERQIHGCCRPSQIPVEIGSPSLWVGDSCERAPELRVAPASSCSHGGAEGRFQLHSSRETIFWTSKRERTRGLSFAPTYTYSIACEVPQSKSSASSSVWQARPAITNPVLSLSVFRRPGRLHYT